MSNNQLFKNFYAVLLSAVILISATAALSAPVSPSTARVAVDGWLALSGNPLRALPAHAAADVATHTAPDGNPLFYSVTLKPEGFAIVPADDFLPPIIAFTGRGKFDPSPTNPLGALAMGDISGRMAALRAKTINPGFRRSCEKKWHDFVSAAKNNSRAKIAGVSDERVAPLIQTAWDQAHEGTALCYNYWTPNNYPCGCLATTLAQLMRFHQHPPIGVRPLSFTIEVNNVKESRALMGGDGQGGPYVWDLMTLDPSSATPEINRMEIGTLCHDAGVAAGANYTASTTSTKFTSAIGALRSVFLYRQAIVGFDSGNDITALLPAMINPGLDAGLPSVLGFSYGSSGHAALCDGYGYVSDTIYHHLNLGWGASMTMDNAWYALPTIDTSAATYDTITICAYNILTYNTGEIISGRITDTGGYPVSGVALALAVTNGPTLTALSDVRGIYSFAGIPSNRDVRISAAKSGYRFSDLTVRTGKSDNKGSTCGNLWEANFTATIANLPVPADYDGDGQADQAWFDGTLGNWKVWQSAKSNAVITFNFGTGRQAVPADYDGDGKTDPAVYCAADGIWQAMLSSAQYQIYDIHFGGSNWQPVPADFDGDGKADPAVYHQISGYWKVLLSGNGYTEIATSSEFGGPTWTATPADFDGDGRADPAVHSAVDARWMVLTSSDQYRLISAVFDEGNAEQAVPADYDGDGKADPAVYQPAAGQWIIHPSASGYTREVIAFGGSGQAATPADYDGDGRAELGLYKITDDSWEFRDFECINAD